MQTIRKPSGMARWRKLIKTRSVTKSNYETRIRKWQLPVCAILARLLRHRRLQQHYSVSRSLVGQRWSLLRKVRKRTTRESATSYHLPDRCVGVVRCSGDQLQSLCKTHTHTQIYIDVNVLLQNSQKSGHIL